jgi:dihydrofolate synthase/folylpolyglutamate synthase
VSNLESYLLKKSNKRGNKNLNEIRLFFSENDLKKLQNNTISVVGTNGKSSTALNIHYLLTSLKYSSLVFTSPHLVNFKERISTEKNIDFDQFLEKLKLFEEKNNLNLGYFEALFLIACQIFLNNDLDYFICEAGIGGLFDTTSIIQSKRVVLTSISHDHTELLGGELKEILRQKIYISKQIDILITGDISEKLKKLINTDYEHINIVKNLEDYLKLKDININQISTVEKNYFLSVMTIDLLLDGKTFDDLIKINLPTNPGRFEIIQNDPLKIIDGAHNLEGVQSLLVDFKRINKAPLIDLFIGFKKGKDYFEILNVISRHQNYRINLIQDNTFFEQQEVAKIAEYLDKIQQKYEIVPIDKFKENKNPSILLGSLYLIGEFKKDT